MLIDPGLAEAIARQSSSEPYRQTKPFTTRKLERWLKERGIGLRWETIHHLWAVGVLHPVAVLAPSLVRTPDLDPSSRFLDVDLGVKEGVFADLGRDVSEDDIGPPPQKLPDELRDSLYWHPFQLWQFEHLALLLDLRIARDTVLQGEESYIRLTHLLLSWAPGELVRFANSDTLGSFLRILPLLLAADRLVHVDVFKLCTYDATAGESGDGYLRWYPAQDGAALLDRFGVSLSEAKRWHERLAFRAQAHDRFGPFRHLVRRSDPNQRSRLKGEALLAQELYDAAEVLRHYLVRYHHVEVSDELAVGSLGPGSGRRSTLRDIMRQLDLDPQERLVWFIEGETEEAYVRTWAERLGIDLREAGIEVRNAKGSGNIHPDRLLWQLEYCKEQKIFAYVSVDEDADGGHSIATDGVRPAEPEHVRQLRWYDKQGLLPIGSKVWPSDFVTANFSTDEIAAIASRMLDDAGASETISAEEIENARHLRPDGRPRSNVQNIEDAVKGLLWDKAKLPFGKGGDWGQALAEWAIDHPRLNEGQEDMRVVNDDARPITQLMLMLLRAKRSDYDFSVQSHTSSWNTTQRDN